MGSQGFGLSLPSPSLLSFLIIICLVLLILVILAFFCIIVFLLLALFLAFCNVLLDWSQHGAPSRNLEVGQSIHLRQNDQHPSRSSTVNENRTWLKIFWMEVWERVWGNQGGLELLEPRLDQFFHMLPPPVKYKIHVRTLSDSDECVICLDNLIDGDYCRLLPSCKHVFHLDCIDKWLNNHATCPICRQCVTLCDNLQKYVPQHSWR